MNSILQRQVLVLNKAWQPINTKSVQEIIPMLCTDVATAMIIDGEDIHPVSWAEWITLPIREQDEAVRSPKMSIRVPTVIVLTSYAKVPKRRPTFSAKSIRERDKNQCQYTGRLLKPGEGNIDHIVPRSKGGKTGWENCVLADRSINSSKAAKLPHEVGLRLIRQPKAPAAVPASALIRNQHGIRDWELFLTHR